MKRAWLLVLPFLLTACPALHMRVDNERIAKIRTVAPFTFRSNRAVLPPVSSELSSTSDPWLLAGDAVLRSGIPGFVKALENAERFKLVEPDRVLHAKSYAAFPAALSGMEATNSLLAPGGWRHVMANEAEPIANVLEEIDADAALITYWRFSLDMGATGPVGAMETATAHAHLRAWLVGRDGAIAMDDEIDTPSQEPLPIRNGRYDRAEIAPAFDDIMITCAVRLAADISNAQSRAKEKG